MTLATSPLSWSELEALSTWSVDRIHGPTNAQAQLRLFGAEEDDVRVTLFRDHHAWCPYCQKVWLWLEEKRIPYRIRKVTMFCYGDKEPWYLERVPSGMLPALELDGRISTESDVILGALEATFGSLGPLTFDDEAAWPLRRLERRLFGAWCAWLCRPTHSAEQDASRKVAFSGVAREMERQLSSTRGPYLLDEFSQLDLVFIPYVERMNASLYYYKGFDLRQQHPAIDHWLTALESRATYLGTQSDFHTHVHDLPPQMGGCYGNGSAAAHRHQRLVDEGPWDALPETRQPEPDHARQEALARLLAHRETVMTVNPAPRELVDVALRASLTTMLSDQRCPAPPGADRALRYVRDRISVPRDMSLYAARRLRSALEATANLAGDEAGAPIPVRHRHDQNPAPFLRVRPSSGL